MSTYFERWKFRHPKPQDFFAVVNEISEQDMTWFFEQTYNSSDVFDYAVGRVTSQPVRTEEGYREQDGAWTYQKGEQVEDDKTDPERSYRSSVFVRRWGEAVFPIETRITFDNGEEVLESWDGESSWVRFNYLKNARVQKVEVDPQHKLVLDINQSNNTWVRQPQAKIASAKWASKWMIWLQNIMEFFAFFS